VTYPSIGAGRTSSITNAKDIVRASGSTQHFDLDECVEEIKYHVRKYQEMMAAAYDKLIKEDHKRWLKNIWK
jgi:hypothetical protein